MSIPLIIILVIVVVLVVAVIGLYNNLVMYFLTKHFLELLCR